MRSVLFSIGKLNVPGYGFMIGIGFIVALLVGEYRAKKKGLNQESVIDMAIIAILCGFLGAKLLYVIVNFQEFIEAPGSVLGRAGFVVYGGIIAGVLCCLLYCHVKKLSFLQYFDLIIPEVAIAQGFGRIGCFLAGCCYGRQTDSAFGVIFPEGSLAPAGVKLIPTQLISAAGDILFAVILIVISDVVFKNVIYGSSRSEAGRESVDTATEESSRASDAESSEKSASKSKKFGHVAGDIGCLYLWMYGVGRFLIEFLRDDYRGAVGALSTSQFISLFIVLGGIVLFVFNRRNIKEK